MKDIGEELRKLGDAAAISLGFIVIEIAVFLAIALIMHAIYCRTPEERGEGSSHSRSRDPGIAVQLMASPGSKWHPSNVHRK